MLEQLLAAALAALPVKMQALQTAMRTVAALVVEMALPLLQVAAVLQALH
jgi:hypothetical protein